MEDILEKYREGKITLEDAKTELRKRLYGEGHTNIDPQRIERTGIPEVVLAEGKSPQQIGEGVSSFLKRSGRALVSRIDTEKRADTYSSIGDEIPIERDEYNEEAGFWIITTQGFKEPEKKGKVGILTAGTSDISVAKEAELTAIELGTEVMTYYDVGVAGVHRLFGPLDELKEWGARVIIVAAGREGALPTLVSGLVDIPVIGLPVSTGYGLHGKGETALFAMLQSCSPLAVVNIDAGFVAGAVASRIARI